MSEEIKPALTRAQWEAALRSGVQRTSMMHELLTALLRGDPVVGIDEPAHALAALLLFDEPFGFTRADARTRRGSSRPPRAHRRAHAAGGAGMNTNDLPPGVPRCGGQEIRLNHDPRRGDHDRFTKR